MRRWTLSTCAHPFPVSQPVFPPSTALRCSGMQVIEVTRQAAVPGLSPAAVRSRRLTGGPGAVQISDSSIPFMPRVEVLDARSGAHLGAATGA